MGLASDPQHWSGGLTPKWQSPFQFRDRIRTLMNMTQSIQDKLLSGHHPMFGLDTLLLAHWQGDSRSTL